MDKKQLREIIEHGTARQKALLLINNDEERQKYTGGFLTKEEEQQIIDSIKKDPTQSREFNKCVEISDRFIHNRFRLYSLQQNIAKITAQLVELLHLWEQAEKEAEFCNTLLRFVDSTGRKNGKPAFSKELEEAIYKHSLHYSRYVTIKRQPDSIEVALDLEHLRKWIDKKVDAYTSVNGIAKSAVIVFKEYIAKTDGEAFVPKDVKAILSSFEVPNTEIPDIYRRDSLLELIKQKGADDREVKYRERYAVVPAWEEIEPYELEQTREGLEK